MPVIETKGAMSAQGFGLTASSGQELLYVESVFATHLYTGNGSTQTITNGIDLDGKGGMVWIKSRSAATNNFLFDTERGALYEINSNTTDASTSLANSLTSFNADGFSIGSATGIGVNAATYASWTFRKAPKFFDVVTYTGNGSNRTIAHNLGSVPGCIMVKRTDTTGDWQVYHRANTANPETDYLVLNDVAATADSNTRWNDTLPTSSVFSLGTDATVNANTGTYVAYLFAHDAGGFGEDGTKSVISCGSFTTPESGNVTVDLGWEPQFVLIKGTYTANWFMGDSLRGLSAPDSGGTFAANTQDLYSNLSAAEQVNVTPYITATGFVTRVGASYAASSSHVYIAIRRGPMKTPTSGTEVFAPLAYTNNPGDPRTTGFPVDLQIKTTTAVGFSRYVTDRLRGVQTTTTFTLMPYLTTNSTNAEATDNTVTYNWGSTGYGDASLFDGYAEVDWNFRRAPGFFDEVCYTGTGSATTVAHNLGVAPELMIVKNRSDATGRAWAVYAGDATDYLVLNTTAATADDIAYWNDTAPTSSVFSVGTSNSTNESGDTFVAYLFASCPGVSKVGNYTGTGTTLQINCGFTGGARFVLIKRTDSTGDWYVWDTARGIVSGNDPYLLLNTSDAEVTNTDYIDAYSAGFEISSTAPAAINANGGSFIYLAIA